MVSGPLPGRFFELWRLEERCSVCGERPRLTVKKRGPGRAWKLCLNDDCPTMVEMREKRAEREAAKQAREEAKTAPNGDRADDVEEPSGEATTPAKAARPNGGRRRVPRKKPDPGTARTKRARSSSKR